MESGVTIKKRTLGEEDPKTLASMHNLAATYGRLGREGEALRLYETVVEARKRILGNEDPDTLFPMHHLALSYGRTDQAQKAIELIQTVVEARRETMVEGHPCKIQSERMLAKSAAEGGQYSYTDNLILTLGSGLSGAGHVVGPRRSFPKRLSEQEASGVTPRSSCSRSRAQLNLPHQTEKQNTCCTTCFIIELGFMFNYRKRVRFATIW